MTSSPGVVINETSDLIWFRTKSCNSIFYEHLKHILMQNNNILQKCHLRKTRVQWPRIGTWWNSALSRDKFLKSLVISMKISLWIWDSANSRIQVLYNLTRTWAICYTVLINIFNKYLLNTLYVPGTNHHDWRTILNLNKRNRLSNNKITCFSIYCRWKASCKIKSK